MLQTTKQRTTRYLQSPGPLHCRESLHLQRTLQSVQSAGGGEYLALSPPLQAYCGPGPEVEAGEDGVAPLPRPAVRHQGVLGWRDAHCPHISLVILSGLCYVVAYVAARAGVRCWAWRRAPASPCRTPRTGGPRQRCPAWSAAGSLSPVLVHHQSQTSAETDMNSKENMKILIL